MKKLKKNLTLYIKINYIQIKFIFKIQDYDLVNPATKNKALEEKEKREDKL